jgi:hypothetical protein
MESAQLPGLEDDTPNTGVFQVGKRFETLVDGKVICTSYNMRTAEIALEKHLGTFVDRRGKCRGKVKPQFVSGATVCTSFSENKFHINERFEFLEKAVTMVADGIQPSVVISGSGGLGKTYTVKKTLLNCGLEDYSLPEEGVDTPSNAFVFIKGFSTPKALYRSLYDNNNAVIVFDDCDSVLDNSYALNILKAALDSYDTRIISWGTESKGNDSLPQRFEFTGQIIFITNLPSEEIDQAIRSRSLMIDVSMTLQETVDRMTEIVKSGSFLPEYDMKIKLEALAFIDEIKEKARELSLRTLITICKIRSEFGHEDWKKMAEYVTCL